MQEAGSLHMRVLNVEDTFLALSSAFAGYDFYIN